MKTLMVTPPLQHENAGGIQVSGRLAWAALQEAHDANVLEVDVRRAWPAVHAIRTDNAQYDVALFWHLDLLRLAFFLPPATKRAVFLHGIEAWRAPGLLTRWQLRHSALLANSRYTLERARPWLPKAALDRAALVPLGVGSPVDRNEAPVEVPIAIMISRLDAGERYKGHHEVLAAWPYVLARLPQAQLFIVGDGDLRAELEAHAAAMSVSASVRFFGRVSESEKTDLLRAARCLVLPSHGEGFGLVYLEAMRLGRPCITGEDAGREVVSPPDGGLSIQPANIDQLCAALVQLLSDSSDWAARSASARARYASGFTEEHFRVRLLRALEALR